jgi:hypothetical protein
MDARTRELIQTSKKIITKMEESNNFDKLDSYLANVLKRPYGMTVLSVLANKRSGLNSFVRTQIKLAMPEMWWKQVERLTRKPVSDLGGSKRKSKRIK